MAKAVSDGAGPAVISIVPGQPLEGDLEDVPVLVSVICPEDASKKRTPSEICCVIDISWSMSMEATVHAAGGKVESNGLSMLDIAKHAVRTVIQSLEPQDSLAIVQFARAAATVLPLVQMDEAGKKLAEEKLDTVGFGNGTALWQGLDLALAAVSAGAARETLSHIMLLTDGETEDKNCVMDKLRAYKHSRGRLPATISCFGFGYEIDSPLLAEIASFSDGAYAFIPDAGFVGTVFVNCMGNLLVTAAKDALLTLEACEGAEVKEVLGWETVPKESGTTCVCLGSLQCGQSKDIVVRMSTKKDSGTYLKATLQYTTTNNDFSVAAEATAPGDVKGPSLAVEKQRCRSRFVAAITEASRIASSGTEESVKQGHELVKQIAKEVADSFAAPDEQVAALLEDIVGQSSEAFSRVDYWKKWGRHYTPSVMFAHKTQQCNNFKDPGVQCYGGELFHKLRDVADSAFDDLPAPKITPAMYRYLGDGKVMRNPQYVDPDRVAAGYTPPAAATQPAVAMAAYNDRYAGCIDGASQAQLASGEMRSISDLKKGDLVKAPGGAEAEVVCVLRTRCEEGRLPLVELPRGLRLTPFHPVHTDGHWRFPVDLAAVQELPCEAVYSFVLRGAPALLAGDLPCAGLGHGIEEGAAAHAYFGTEKVLRDLGAAPGFGEGLVELRPGCAVRDPETGLVCGLRFGEAEEAA